MKTDPSVTLVEVGPRDGLQNESTVLQPAVRAELCARLLAAGIRRLEAVSFVNPNRVPQMAAPDELLEVLGDVPSGASVEGLVLNEKGFDRALVLGVKAVRYSFGISETFTRKNQNTGTDEACKLGLSLLKRARECGVRFGVVLATSFGCPFEGEVEARRVLSVADRWLSAQPDELIFADTIGVGVPSQVKTLVGSCVDSGVAIGGHFHNTRNTGYLNAWTALEGGASVLDASVGGLGGCPFAPGATGNIATEDLVYLLERMGVKTGVDVDALIDISKWLQDVLKKPLPGMLYRSGMFP
ncbi:MAG: hydroxymethylglutaryl-CoA lyase [Deinococcaceae bacterium]